MTVKIKKVKDNAKIPKRATNGSAGMDLYACIDEKITINPGQLVLVHGADSVGECAVEEFVDRI